MKKTSLCCSKVIWKNLKSVCYTYIHSVELKSIIRGHQSYSILDHFSLIKNMYFVMCEKIIKEIYKAYINVYFFATACILPALFGRMTASTGKLLCLQW